MALGTTYNNNKNQDYRPTVYSFYKWYNSESTVDKTALSVSFWKGLVKIAIAPKASGESDTSFDYQNEVKFHLTHTKARIFYNEILKFMAGEVTNVGVNSNKGLISVTNGAELGASNPCLIIRILNNESGAIEASACYEFKSNFHFAVRNFDEKTKRFDTEYYNNVELEEFASMLKGYYEAATNAIAYTVVDQMSFDINRVTTRLMSIQDKLGIQGNSSKGGNRGFASNSFFNGSKPSNGLAPVVSSESCESIAEQLDMD